MEKENTMKKARMIAVAAVMLAAMATTSATAQTPAMPKPGPEVEKLKYFLGNWKEEGTIKPGPMGPGGKFTGTSKNEWLPGGFFIGLRGATDMTTMGKFTTVAYLGYDAENKVYTYDEFASTGEHTVAKGTVEGDTWTWTNEYKEGGKAMKGRFTEKITSPTSYDFKFEASMDGGEYATMMEGKATRGAAATGAKPAAKPAGAAKTPTKTSAADTATKTSASADGAEKAPKK